jgi:hypothetical protein
MAHDSETSRVSRRSVVAGLASIPLITPFRAYAASSFNLVTDFGAVGDGVTDNSEAFAKFGTAARSISATGNAVQLFMPPGQYQYNAKACFGFLFNIRQLEISAYGASVQNTYDTRVADSNYEFPWPHVHAFRGADYVLNNEGLLIETTKAGDRTVKLKAAQSERVATGAYLLIASLNIQYMGYPHNCDRFDYVKILESDPLTGILTLDRPLKYAHQDDFPELHDRAYCSGPHVGRARVWDLNKYELHDIDHRIEGLTILSIAHKTRDYHDIFHAAGRRQTFVNCTLPGYGVSNLEHFEVRGCRINGHGEIDKLIDTIVIEDCDFRGGLNFQSSSVENVRIRNCAFSDATSLASLYTGTAKNIEITDCKIDTLSEGQFLGMSRNLTIANCTIKKWGGGQNAYSQYGDISGPLLQIDGVDNTYANGVFTFRNFAASILRNQSLIFNAIPGAQINLAGPNLGLGFMLTSDTGSGIVTHISETDGHFIVATTLPYATLPDWCSQKFRIQRCGTLRITNSAGCEAVVAASQADTLGKRPFEYHHHQLGADGQASGAFMLAGDVLAIEIHVVKAMPGRTLTIMIPQCLDGKTFRDHGRLQVTIDLGTAGLRGFDQAKLTGKTSADSVKLGQETRGAMPTGIWLYQNAFWSFGGVAGQGSDRLVVDMKVYTDMGRFRTLNQIEE